MADGRMVGWLDDAGVLHALMLIPGTWVADLEEGRTLVDVNLARTYCGIVVYEGDGDWGVLVEGGTPEPECERCRLRGLDPHILADVEAALEAAERQLVPA